ncbi:MAG TPA: autotransporter-associated beta strand repeat-containing protein, partial [Candidatus Anammoximicrobium sp.]|nr:autotransporter-associated beta strand repeat-containing protein [Candidatus Anammoximicrobium sp.]
MLEDRRLLASFLDANPTLSIDLNAASENVALVSNGTSYTLTLNGANTWTGANTANVTGNGTGTLTVTAAGLAAFNTVNITDSASGCAVTFGNSGANAYSDDFNIVLDNSPAGQITFNGASSFGTSSLSASTMAGLVVSSGATVTASSPVTLAADSMDIQGTITSNGGITLQPATPSRTIGLNSGTGDFNLTLVELGNLASTGTVTIGRSGGTGAITIGSTAAVNLATEDYGLTLRGGDATFSRYLQLASGKTVELQTGAVASAAGSSADITAGTVVLNTSGAVGASNNPLSLAVDSLQGTANGSVYVSESNSLTISGPLSAGANTIQLNSGTFALGASNLLDDASMLKVIGTVLPATFAMGDYSDTVAGVTLGSPTTAGNITGNAGAVLTSASDFDLQFGTISARLAGPVGLNKTTTRDVTLSNTGNTFTGPTVISDGTLRINGDGCLGIPPAAPTAGHLIIDGGRLEVTASMTLSPSRGISIGTSMGQGDGIINVPAGVVLTYNGVIADNGTGADRLVKLGLGTLVLGGNNSFSGGTEFRDASSGAIQLNTVNALGSVGDIVFTGSGTLRYGLGITTDLSSRITTASSAARAIIDTNGNHVTFATEMTLSGDLEKQGQGTLTLVAPGETQVFVLVVSGGELALTNGTLKATGSDPGWLEGPSFVVGEVSVFLRNAQLSLAGGTLQTSQSLFAGKASSFSTGTSPWKLDVSAGSLQVGGNLYTTLGTVGADPALVTIHGGTTQVAGNFYIGLNTRQVAYISDGTVSVAGNLVVGRTSYSDLYVSGGTVTARSLRHEEVGDTARVFLSGGVVTVDEVVNETAGETLSKFEVNLDAGGTLVTDRIYLNRTGGASGTHTLDLRFDGGTLRPKSDPSSAPVINLIDDFVIAPGAGFTELKCQATIEDGGAFIDIPGPQNARVLRPVVHDTDLDATPDGGLTKQGAGTLTLNHPGNTYTGETDIVAGTLALAAASVNNIPASTLITVRAGAVLDVLGLNGNTIALANGQTLQGHGRVEGQVTARLGSTVSPGIIPEPSGTNPGRLTTDGAAFQTDSNFVVDIEGRVAGSEHDQLRVNGPVTILAGAMLQTPGTFLPSEGDEIVIIDNDGTDAVILGTEDRGFNNLREGGVYDSNFRGTGLRAVISYVGGDGNDVVLRFPSSGFRFDFNGFHGYTAPNYVPVAPELVKTPSNNYGWDAPMESFERPEDYPAPHPTVDLLLWDGHVVQLDTVRTFQVEVDPNTKYQVSIATGDWVHPHDWQQFRAYDPGPGGLGPIGDDQTKVVSTQADVTEYTTVRFEVQVGTSGLLYVQIRDLPNPVIGAETNPSAVILGMDVRPIENVNVITVVPPAAGALPADGLSVDTYTGSGAPPDALLTVRASNQNEYDAPPWGDVTASNLGTITTADQDMYRTYTQVVSDFNGDFTFDLRRPTGTGPVLITVDPAPGQHVVPAEGAGRVLPADAFGMYRGTYIQEYDLPRTRLLDFNAGNVVTATDYPGTLGNETIAEDYVGVPLSQTYDLTTTNALGWNAAPTPPPALPLASFDRGGPDALLRDGHYGYESKFLVDLPDGPYIVNTVIGDTSPFYHDQVQVYALGALQTTVSTAPGQWTSSSFVVNVPADPDPLIAPQLDVRLRDAGGVDPHWVLNALRVRPAPAQPIVIARTMPTGSGALDTDATGTTVDTFQGSGAPANSLVTVATTLGTIVSSDLSTTYQGVQVQADEAGVFSFQIRRPSGTGGSGTETATITAQEVLGRNLGSTAQDYQPPQTPDTVLRFDMGSSATYTQAGFTHVGPRDIFSATRGYGWSTRVAAADRPNTGWSNLNRDLHSGSNARFQVQVGPGSYSVRVYLSNPLGTGGYPYTYDNFEVRVENGVSWSVHPVTSLMPGAVEVQTLTGDPGADNILDIWFVDLGGQNFNWVVSGIEITSGSFPDGSAILNLLAAAPAAAAGGGATIDDAMLAPLVSEAAARWSAAGLTPAQAAVLNDLHVG